MYSALVLVLMLRYMIWHTHTALPLSEISVLPLNLFGTGMGSLLSCVRDTQDLLWENVRPSYPIYKYLWEMQMGDKKQLRAFLRITCLIMC